MEGNNSQINDICYIEKENCFILVCKDEYVKKFNIY